MNEPTYEKMTIKELIYHHGLLVNAINQFTVNHPSHYFLGKKIAIVEKLLRIKKPSYFEEKKRDILDRITDDYYTLQETALIFCISRQTMYNWIKQKFVKTKKFGKHQYISKKEVERITEHGTIST